MKDDSDKRIVDYGEVLDYDPRSKLLITQVDKKRFFMHRLCV